MQERTQVQLSTIMTANPIKCQLLPVLCVWVILISSTSSLECLLSKQKWRPYIFLTKLGGSTNLRRRKVYRKSNLSGRRLGVSPIACFHYSIETSSLTDSWDFTFSFFSAGHGQTLLSFNFISHIYLPAFQSDFFPWVLVCPLAQFPFELIFPVSSFLTYCCSKIVKLFPSALFLSPSLESYPSSKSSLCLKE